jgi:hypothetical protein
MSNSTDCDHCQHWYVSGCSGGNDCPVCQGCRAQAMGAGRLLAHMADQPDTCPRCKCRAGYNHECGACNGEEEP